MPKHIAVLAGLLIAATVSPALAQAPPELARGVELYEAGERKAAAEFFASVEDESARPWVAFYQGRIELDGGELDAAIERLSEATAGAPDSSLFQRWLAEAYVRKIDTVGMLQKMSLAQKAKAGFEEAVRLAPEDPEAREALAGYYLNAPPIAGGSKEKAEEQVAALEKLAPIEGKALRGRIHANAGEWDQAAAVYREVIALAPAEARYRYDLGFALQQAEDWDGAFAAFEEAIEVDEGFLNAYYQLGRTAVFAKTNLDRAAECLEHYLAQDHRPGTPEHEHAHWRLGMVLEHKGDKEGAAEQYRAALERDPEHEEAQKALAALGG